MIIIWLIIGFGIYYFFKNNTSMNFKPNKDTEAEEKLKQRYVNGEIDDETYARILKAIRN